MFQLMHVGLFGPQDLLGYVALPPLKHSGAWAMLPCLTDHQIRSCPHFDALRLHFT